MKRKKILFLSPYPKGIGPSQRFRFEQYLDLLSKKYDCKQKTFWDTKSWDVLFSEANFLKKTFFLFVAFLKRSLLLFSINKYDFVFIHREVAHIGPPIFEWIIAKLFRKEFIYDFDDAIWQLNYSNKNRIVKYFKYPKKVEKICKWSSIIVTGNEYLANYAKQFNKNVVIIPTTIDTNYHIKNIEQKSKSKLSIGWTGTLTTLKHIELILPVLKELRQNYEFEFVVIANDQPKLDIDFIRYLPWKKESEITDLSKIDIGIMPLPDNKWEKGKCGFKGLQYMALEIPSVMSPVGVNSEIIEDGKNGFLAAAPKEWIEKLSLLIESEVLRKELGQAGRATVIKKYSVEANKQKYFDLFDRLS